MSGTTAEMQKPLYCAETEALQNLSKPPVFCLEPLPEEDQRRKGLFTQKRPTFSNVEAASVYPSLAARKPLFSTFDGEPPIRPFADGNVFPLFAERHIKPTEGKAEKQHFHNLSGTPAGQFPQLDGKPEIPERCLTGAPLTPYCDCPHSNCSATTLETLSTLPAGALEEHRPDFIPIWLAYKLQTRQSHCFDIDDYPGGGTTSLRPLPPSVDFNNEAGLPLELANRAIQEYNEKECNGSSYQYWMTVNVLNLTLATPIETFQIHAGFQAWNDERVVYCCQPKEEVIVGFESCNVCYGKLHGEGYHGDNSKGTRALVF